MKGHNAPCRGKNVEKPKEKGRNRLISPSKNFPGRPVVDRPPKRGKEKPPESVEAQRIPGVDLVDIW